jgi:5-methylcytosine-specific restriction endonuclease McrA
MPLQRYHNSVGWRRTAKLAIARNGGRCVDCGSASDLSADHLVADPLRLGGNMAVGRKLHHR